MVPKEQDIMSQFTHRIPMKTIKAIRALREQHEQLQDQASLRARQEQIDPDVMIKNLSALRQQTLRVEHNLPLLKFKTKDEVAQMKLFIKTYYFPILSEIDLMKLQ